MYFYLFINVKTVERSDNGTALTNAFCESCTSDTGDLGETSNSAFVFTT